MRLLSVFLFAVVGVSAQIPGMDMAVFEKWSKAKVIRYQIVGLHKGRTKVILGDHEGKADVTDKIVIEVTVDSRRKIVGEPKVTDFPAEVTNVGADGTKCAPPQLKGTYEHFVLSKFTVNGGNDIQLVGTKNYPDAMVAQWPASCSQAPVKGGKEEKMLFVPILEATMLGMPVPKEMKGMSVAADRKSFSVTGDDEWVWTYTPTLVQ